MAATFRAVVDVRHFAANRRGGVTAKWMPPPRGGGCGGVAVAQRVGGEPFGGESGGTALNSTMQTASPEIASRVTTLSRMLAKPSSGACPR